MFKSIILVVLVSLTLCAIQKGYTLINIKQYNNQHFGASDNTTQVVIGTYLTDKGSVDALNIYESPYTFNINPGDSLRGKTKYFKVMGSEQNYQNLIKISTATIANGISNHRILKPIPSQVIIDWDHKLSADDKVQIQYITWLKGVLSALPDSHLKIPAHYLCKPIQGTPFFKHLNHKKYIIQMYGNQNPYLTYQSIFSQNSYQSKDGYSAQCPQNPSTLKLKQILSGSSFHIQKSLHSQYRGYVGQMNQWIKQASANNLFDGVVFFDSHPANLFRI